MSNQTLDRFLTKSLSEANSLVAEMRKASIRAILSNSTLQPVAVATSLQRELNSLIPLLTENLADSTLGSWALGADYVQKLFPDWLQEEFRTGIRANGSRPPVDPPTLSIGSPDDDSNNDWMHKYSVVENAQRRLVERNVVTRDQWDSLDLQAKQQAFMITGDLASETIDKVRNELITDLADGTSLGGFRERVGEILARSGLSDSRIETIYRTNVQSGFRDGRESIARDPIVMEAFPYQAYVAVHDARARHEHIKLESLGLDGTNIYRRDDPVWDYFTPPWDFNCRCTVILMDVATAARQGVREAQVWLETGYPPETPEHCLARVLRSIQPNPDFGYRGALAV